MSILRDWNGQRTASGRETLGACESLNLSSFAMHFVLADRSSEPIEKYYVHKKLKIITIKMDATSMSAIVRFTIDFHGEIFFCCCWFAHKISPSITEVFLRQQKFCVRNAVIKSKSWTTHFNIDNNRFQCSVWCSTVIMSILLNRPLMSHAHIRALLLTWLSLSCFLAGLALRSRKHGDDLGASSVTINIPI